MKLKGWKKLGEKLFSLGVEIDENLQIFLSNEDACYPNEDTVFFSILRTTSGDERFMDNLRKVHPDAPKLPTYIYTFLHEIGHIMTKEVYNAENSEDRARIKATGDFDLYFSLESEKVATAWAVNYAIKNWIFVGWLTVEMEKAIKEFTDANADK